MRGWVRYGSRRSQLIERTSNPGHQSDLLLDGGCPKGRALAAISCRKSEIALSLPHEQSIPSACQIVGVRRFQGAFATTKAPWKNLLLKISCNSLISLDPDERIQGNPSFYNPQNLGFSQRNGTFQENPNRVDERASRPVEKEPADSIQMHSGLAPPRARFRAQNPQYVSSPIEEGSAPWT
jgi:hypothetical protein